MPQPSLTLLRPALLLALLSLTLPSAQAATCRATHTCKTKIVRLPVDNGSAETPLQRERRLKRECKGRPNAGACEGYAR